MGTIPYEVTNRDARRAMLVVFAGETNISKQVQDNFEDIERSLPPDIGFLALVDGIFRAMGVEASSSLRAKRSNPAAPR